MSLSRTDELQIQRCVDNELSAQDTAALMQRLDDVPGGWKILAGELLEERTLSGAISLYAATREQAGGEEEAAGVAASAAVSRPFSRRWLSSPITSVALCTAIAFVGGMLVPAEHRPGAAAENQMIAGASSTAPSGPVAPLQSGTPEQGIPASSPSYQLNLQPVSGSGQPGVSVPVMSDRESFDVAWSRDRLALEEQLLSKAPYLQRQEESQIRILVVPLDDGRRILVPVEDVTLSPNLQ